MSPTSTPNQVVERLLKAGADPHAADGDGRTARLVVPASMLILRRTADPLHSRFANVFGT